jgi:hypothetical protein
MAITKAELQQRISQILENDSNNVNTNPKEARQRLAAGLASAIYDFVITRETKVTGITTDGKGVTGTGIIQSN